MSYCGSLEDNAEGNANDRGLAFKVSEGNKTQSGLLRICGSGELGQEKSGCDYKRLEPDMKPCFAGTIDAIQLELRNQW